MEIIIINKAEKLWGDKDYQAQTISIINLAMDHLGCQKKFSNSVISIVLADDDFVRGLNNLYRGKDKPTNILSFPDRSAVDDLPEGDETPGLGDLILSFETIMQESQEQGKSFDHHLSHLLIHGFLHLLGYDHIEDKDAQLMEGLEIAILQKLDIANPYL